MYFFGPISGFSSYPVVMRGLKEAFEFDGLSCLAMDITGGEHGAMSGEDTSRLSLGLPPTPRESNLVFAMKPTVRMGALVVEHGMTLVGLHVGDVDTIPPEWKLVMQHEKLIVVPSAWMRGVVEGAGFSNIVVANHGVERAYLDAPLAPSIAPGPIRFLHTCSSGVFPERKSTPAVFAAFQRLVSDGCNITMTLVVSELRKPIKRLLGGLDVAARDRVLTKSLGYGLSTDKLIELYSTHHALLCPSRAEGFGIQPLECRALGIPVVQTLCTGMRDHLPETENPRSWGIVPVEHGPMVPAWGDFGAAPEVTSESIKVGMLELIDNYDKIKETSVNRAKELHVWSWQHRTHDLAVLLKGMEETT